MALRLNIDQITMDTPDWTCKVQIVDMSRERESLEKKIRFQNLILEDEEEQQIRGVMYGDDIGYYADKLTLLNTYLISAARVRISPTSYGRPIHKFYWVLDKETLIERVKPTDEHEKPLPPPTKLEVTTFADIAHMTGGSATEIDILAVVLRCGPQKYAGRFQKRCREITVGDNQERQFLLTLWEDFAEVEGGQLQIKMEKDAEFPVILARNIGISDYQGLSLHSRFNSTICINPSYPQALELFNWAKTNKAMLSGYELDNVAGSSTLVTATPLRQQVISIAKISSKTTNGIFHVEAEMTISNDLQNFCVLECSGCKQKKRTKYRKDFECPTCRRQTTPRCTFQIDLIDGSGSKSALISGDVAEKMLSMTAGEIFATTCMKKQLLPINQVQERLSNRLFRIQLRKSSWKSSNVTHTILSLLSYTEKEVIVPPNVNERTIKKVKPLSAGDLMSGPSEVVPKSSRSELKIEPPTPAKKP